MTYVVRDQYGRVIGLVEAGNFLQAEDMAALWFSERAAFLRRRRQRDGDGDVQDEDGPNPWDVEGGGMNIDRRIDQAERALSGGDGHCDVCEDGERLRHGVENSRDKANVPPERCRVCGRQGVVIEIVWGRRPSPGGGT